MDEHEPHSPQWPISCSPQSNNDAVENDLSNKLDSVIKLGASSVPASGSTLFNFKVPSSSSVFGGGIRDTQNCVFGGGLNDEQNSKLFMSPGGGFQLPGVNFKSVFGKSLLVEKQSEQASAAQTNHSERNEEGNSSMQNNHENEQTSNNSCNMEVTESFGEQDGPSIEEQEKEFWANAAKRPPFVPKKFDLDLEMTKLSSSVRSPPSPEDENIRIQEHDSPMRSEEISLLNKILHKKLENLRAGSVEISQVQNDPNSPLFSASTFESLRLKDALLKALCKMGFHMPSKIQEAALPLLLIEPPQNMIAQAQSGTGKTAAFVLTMLSRVVVENKWPQCLCLAPTYELAMQIGQVVQQMSEFMPEIKVYYAVKGQMGREKVQEQIVIGTPGKMLDYVLKWKLIDPSKIICFVLDEADVMISQQGYLDQSLRLYNELQRAGAKYQSLLFSATYDDSVRSFADSIIKDAVNITVRREEQTLKNIKQYYVRCADRNDKCTAVMNLYGGLTIASAIIFCYTRRSAQWLANRMAQRGHEVVVLHGEMPIEDRARIIQEFKEGRYKVLLTTNVCARGIDVYQVSVVINYDPPVTHTDPPMPDFETYLHRIGRTGRFGKEGIAINLASDENSFNIIEKIGEHFGKKIELLDASDLDQLEAIDRAEF